MTAWALLLPACVVAGAFGMLQTEAGRDALLEQAASRFGVRVQGASGVWPFSFAAARLSVSDPAGEWLALDDVAVSWGAELFPPGLSGGRVSVGRAVMKRPPAYPKTSPEPPPVSLRELAERAGRFAALVPQREPVTLEIRELSLPASGAFPARTVSLQGALSVAGESRFMLRSLSGPASSAEARFTLKRGAALSVNEEEGGALAALAGLQGPLKLKAEVAPQGQGFALEASGAARGLGLKLNGTVVIGDDRSAVFSLSGLAFLGPEAPLSPGLAALLAGKTSFSAQGTAAGGAVRLERLALNGPHVRAALLGGVFGPEGVAGALTLTADEAALLHPQLHGGAELTVNLSGMPERPMAEGALRAALPGLGAGPYAEALLGKEARFSVEAVRPLSGGASVRVSVTTQAAKLTLHDAGLGEGGALSGELSAELSAEAVKAMIPPGMKAGEASLTEFAGALHADIRLGGTLAAPHLEARAGLKGGKWDQAALTSEISRSPQGNVLLRGVTLAAPGLKLEGEAEADAAGAARGKFRLRSAAVERMTAPFMAASLAQGGAEAEAEFTSKAGVETLALTMKGSGLKLAALPPELSAVLGGAPEARLRAVRHGNDVELETLDLAAAALEAHAVRLRRAANGALSGEVTATLRLPENASWAPAAARGVRADLRLTPEGTLEAPAARLRLSLEHHGATAELSGRAAREKTSTALTELHASGPGGAELRGDLRITDAAAASGRLLFTARQLAPLAALIPQAAGAAGDDARADITVSDSGGKQSAELTAGLKRAAFGGFSAESVSVTAVSADIRKGEGVTLDAQAQGVRGAGPKGFAAQGKLHAEGGRSMMTIRADVSGQGGGHKAAALLEARTSSGADGGFTADLRRLEGQSDALSFALAEPAAVTLQGENVRADKLRLRLNTGELSLSGGAGLGVGGRSDLTLTLKRLPAAAFAPGREGEISGEASLSGPSAAPQLTADFAYTDPEFADAFASFRARVTAQDGAAHLTLSAAPRAASGVSPAEAFTAEAYVPLRLSLAPFAADLPPQGTLTGGVRADMDLAALSALALPPGQEARGKLKGALALSGTLSAPRAEGTLHFSDLVYANAAAGIGLEQGHADLTAHGDTLTLSGGELRAGKGRVLLSGAARLNAPYPFDMKLKAEDAALPRSSVARGILNGELLLKGTPAAVNLSGALTADPMEITLPELRETPPPSAKIRNPSVLPRQPWSTPETAASALPTGSPKIGLDLTLRAPGQVYVSGRGLRTELRGEIRVTGTAASPMAVGELRSVHGTFALLDRDLTITEGVLKFRGAMPPSPYVVMKAETVTSEMTAGVALEGPASDPKLRLTSEPTRPEDEILAHLLFGRELKSITPLQGVRLARAAAQLRGGGGGSGGMWDVVGKARSLLGVDRLSVDQNAAGEYEAGAGKYIGDKIYVGVQSGADPASGRVTTETELTPNVTVETETGREGGGVRFNWKKDY